MLKRPRDLQHVQGPKEVFNDLSHIEYIQRDLSSEGVLTKEELFHSRTISCDT